MKNFNKLLLTAFLPLSLLSLTSCEKAYYASAKRVAPFLHEITYNDYEFDKNYETLLPADGVNFNFGCSSIRNGDYYGRNYDFYYSNSPSVLVKMKGNAHRFKSIGIANNLTIEENDLIEAEASKHNQHMINIIPNFMLDGINENGVVCNMNTVDFDDGGGAVLSTNPGKPKVFLFFALRFVLDNATSASHAIELLNNSDIYSLGTSGSAVHFMIADIKDTYIVEFITKDGVTELRADKKENNERIMTNFYNNMTDDEEEATYKENPKAYINGYNNNASGTERYEFIKKNYADCATSYGMWSVLHDIKFGDMYLNPNKPDYPSEDFSQEEIAEAGEDWTDPELLATYRQIYNLTRYTLDGEYRNLGRLTDTWITMHSEVFDIKEKTLRLNVQEDYTRTFNYDLNF